MIVVISVGGSVLARALDPEKFKSYALALKEISKKNTLFVVTGGGQAARDYIGIARQLGADEATCDLIGIELTRLNARLLIAALDNDAYYEPPLDYKKAKNASLSGKIVVMGGVAPGQTTDAVSAVLAEYTGADLLINATAIDGVYTSDPKKDKDATKFESMTPKQLIEIIIRTEMIAGANSPTDLLAAKIIERSNIKTIVLNGENPQNIIDAVYGEHIGTVIQK
ncbi:putative uridylate kinase [Candidatus Methanoperedens nitroreducens]|uniref:Uridylate kinase n=1 Tax=Candidatus Methanoperedens nitratireducens TaxID=1392998 RepID=A0A062V0Z4_9EURY|nr:UMP kinase [Candidatus Methanoperedens nitroreducens]KCZ71052.1 putative uridylate kinase [Candidatus Methanoperedens nitroreducens]MDJ1421573.1 UMP kinase [Candidatus Methanoperedens sp.]